MFPNRQNQDNYRFAVASRPLAYEEFLSFYSAFTRRMNSGVPLTNAEPSSNIPQPVTVSPATTTPGIILKITDDEISKLFECPVCYEIIAPPITLCVGGHSICSTCLERLKPTWCPTCRGDFTEIRNRLAEEFLERFTMIRCKHRESGCRVAASASEITNHEIKCDFRPVCCWSCDEVVPYHLFLKHLVEKEAMRPQRISEIHGFGVGENVEHFVDGVRVSFWEMWFRYKGLELFCFLETAMNDMHELNWWIWVGALESEEVCQNSITCTLTLFRESTKMRIRYSGPISSIRSTPQAVLESGKCLIFRDSVMKKFMVNGNICLDVKIKLKI